jgi:hypothetical protein
VDEEHEIIGILGFPGHPWSRGKVEVTLREFNKAIKKFAGSGFIRNEKDKNEVMSPEPSFLACNNYWSR